MIPYSPIKAFPIAVSLVDTTDTVMGGTGGTANVATKQLADRTEFLRELHSRLDGITAIHNLISSTHTLSSGQVLSKLVTISIAAAANMTVTLPDAAALPSGTIARLLVGGIATKCVKIAPAAGQFINDGSGAALDAFYMYNAETLTLISYTTGVWIVLDYLGNHYRVGEQVLNWRPAPGLLQKNGQLVNRDDYPRLWAFLNAHAYSSAYIMSDTAWSSSTKVGFSSGNGTTTFRMPYVNMSATGGTWHGVIF